MFLAWSELSDPSVSSASNTSIISTSTICKLRLQRRVVVDLLYWWWAQVVIEIERWWCEEGPVCRIWWHLTAENLNVPVLQPHGRHRIGPALSADIKGSFSKRFICSRSMKIYYSADRSPQNLWWPNFSLYLFIFLLETSGGPKWTSCWAIGCLRAPRWAALP